MNRRLAGFCGLMILAAACRIGDKKYLKPKDLASASLVDKLRLLAVVAEPPEAQPGDEIRFSALVIDPAQVAGGTLWLVCPPAPDTDGDGDAPDVNVGCLTGGSFDLSDPSTAQDNVIGFEPGLPPKYTVPDDALDGMLPGEASYGTVEVAVLPQTLIDEGFGGSDFTGSVDFNELEAGYKRFVISEAQTPNHNPVIDSITVESVPIAEDEVVEVDPEQTYDLGAFLPQAAIERFVYTLTDGRTQVRYEQPYASWYTDGGALSGSQSSYPFLSSRWLAPAADAKITSGHWWVVIRDRRGGMTWAERRWRLRAP